MAEDSTNDQLLKEFEKSLAAVLTEDTFGLERHQRLFDARGKVEDLKGTPEYSAAVLRAATTRL